MTLATAITEEAERRLKPSWFVALSRVRRRLRDMYVQPLYGRDLCRLAKLYGSDKWGTHWYTPHYEFHFARLRRRRLTVLEIGVGGYDRPRVGGASLRMWRAYFPRSRVFGVDVYDKSFHDERRIKTFQGSQSDPAFPRRVADTIGGIDIIIDDGSHVNTDVLTSFEVLFPLLHDGGIYVIEDTQTAHWEEFGGRRGPATPPDTSLGFVKTLVDGLNYEEFGVDGYRPTYYDQHVVSLHFYHNLIFIYKGQNLEGSNRFGSTPGSPTSDRRTASSPR